MADTPYQRSIDQAARTLAAANADWQRIADLMAAIPAADKATGGSRENEYADLSKQLDGASKRFNSSEQAYQDAIQLADRSQATAKEFLPAGTTRQRLDTTSGNVLVSVTETADGRGGWSVDPSSVKRVAVEGAEAGGARITTPTSEKYIVTMGADGKLTQKDNPNYVPDKNAGPTAVPTSEFIYEGGTVKPNPAYRPPNAEINTSAEYINDPAKPGTLIKNPNYKAPAPPPMTPGQTAVDTATASTAEGVAQANLAKAKADADKAQLDLENARRIARQAPNDQQAQHAIDTAQQQLDLAVQQQQAALDQLKKVNPIAADQAEATLTQTRQTIEKGKLGDLYGLQDRIKQVRDLIALGPKNGGITPEDGDAMIAAAQRGTTVYDAQRQMQADRSTARTQDVQNADSMTRPFGQIFTQGLTEMADMNKYAKVGSTAGADAFVALMNMAQDRLKQYAVSPAQTTNYLGPSSSMSGLVNAAQQQIGAAPGSNYNPNDIQWRGAAQPGGFQDQSAVMPQAPAPPPAPAGTTSAPITINIGGGSRTMGGEAAGGPPPVAPPAQPSYHYTPETSAQSVARNTVDPLNGLVSTAARSTPATNAEVLQTLYPNVARKFGLL